MPVLIELNEEKRYVTLRLIDPWGMPDLMEKAIAIVQPFIYNGPGKAHMFVDLTKARHIPSGILGTRRNGEWSHPNNGYYLIYGASGLAKTLLDAMARLVHSDQFYFFNTEAEAIRWLETTLEKTHA